MKRSTYQPFLVAIVLIGAVAMGVVAGRLSAVPAPPTGALAAIVIAPVDAETGKPLMGFGIRYVQPRPESETVSVGFATSNRPATVVVWSSSVRTLPIEIYADGYASIRMDPVRDLRAEEETTALGFEPRLAPLAKAPDQLENE